MGAPRPWSERGPELQEIARRVRAGETPAQVSRAMGLSPWVAQQKCKEVAAALNVPTAADLRADLDRRVAALVEDGLTDPEIAAALNVSYGRVVGARHRAIGPKFTLVRLTAEEHAKIDLMVRQGFAAKEIAIQVGCSSALVNTRAEGIPADSIEPIRPPCPCGKPAGHASRCRSLVPADMVRRRLLDGATCADIARELGIKPSGSFKAYYCQPVIDQMTAEGLRCSCGAPFGHSFMCKVTGQRQKIAFSEAQLAEARKLVASGSTALTVRRALGVNAHAAGALVRDIRADLARVGSMCPCGKPIDHECSCPARRAATPSGVRFRFSARTKAAFSKQRLRLISRLARMGWSPRVVATRTGESLGAVTRAVDELSEGGLLPSKCAGCEKAYDHPQRCGPKQTCACGRPDGHRGDCGKPAPAAKAARRAIRTKLPDEQLAEIKRRLRAGESGTKIGIAIGVSPSTVNGIIRRLRAGSTYPHKPCACGRPARHPGSCVVNAPAHAATKLEKARIATAIRAGDQPHQIADRLGISTETVLKHSLALREELFAAGVTCACGRLIGHRHWCSARWESFGFPSRARPLPPHKAAAVRQALLRGDAAQDISVVAGVSIKRIWEVRHTLSGDERSLRARLIRGRLGIGRPQGRKLVEIVQAAVPTRVDAAIRHEVIAELHLAVIEGRVEVEQLRDAAKKLIRDAQRELFHSRTRSMGEVLVADGRRETTLGDTLGDSAGLALIDEIEIGGES